MLCLYLLVPLLVLLLPLTLASVYAACGGGGDEVQREVEEV